MLFYCYIVLLSNAYCINFIFFRARSDGHSSWRHAVTNLQETVIASVEKLEDPRSSPGGGLYWKPILLYMNPVRTGKTY